MTTIRHPNRRRHCFAALTRALIAWHPGMTQGDVLALRTHWPRWPRITPDRDPPPAAAMRRAAA